MEILFKQTPLNTTLPASPLEYHGIERCYLKHLSVERDRSAVTRKRHHHTGFEIHMIEHGSQTYKTDTALLTVRAGELLLIPPLVKHCMVEEMPGTSKYSITFSLKSSSILSSTLSDPLCCLVEKIPFSLSDTITAFRAELHSNAPYTSLILSGRILECILRILRFTNPLDLTAPPPTDEDVRLTLAKQYIQDNLRQDISLTELATYCCISSKQLTRIFRKEEGISATEYIRRQRCQYIEKLLADPSLSLRTISDMMHFNNEYYFNTFFKKHAGMSPGAYRLSVRHSR